VSASKRLIVWIDVNEHQMDMQAPNSKGKIRVKAMRLPKGVQLKEIPRPSAAPRVQT
jgi:hypothetical protein